MTTCLELTTRVVTNEEDVSVDEENVLPSPLNTSSGKPSFSDDDVCLVYDRSSETNTFSDILVPSSPGRTAITSWVLTSISSFFSSASSFFSSTSSFFSSTSSFFSSTSAATSVATSAEATASIAAFAFFFIFFSFFSFFFSSSFSSSEDEEDDEELEVELFLDFFSSVSSSTTAGSGSAGLIPSASSNTQSGFNL